VGRSWARVGARTRDTHLVETESDVVAVQSESVQFHVQKVLLEGGGDGGLGK
jgi:hypothetical protein